MVLTNFSGDNRYQLMQKYWNKISSIPFSFRRLIAWLVVNIPTNKFTLMNKFNDKKLKICDAFLSKNVNELYLKLISPIHNPNIWLNNFEVNLPDTLISTDRLLGCSDVERMMVSDVLGYLPDDILTKVDRAAMSISLETRIPFRSFSCRICCINT